LRTVVIGFGKMSRGYADDSAMAKYYRYSTHAQALAAHPRFDWVGVVDPADEARRSAQTDWSVFAAEDVESLGPAVRNVEIAVLATPPDQRLAIVEQFPNLRAVLVEKPLGVQLTDAQKFLDACAARDIQVQVNLWRRSDQQFRALAEGQLVELIGPAQAACVFYGNGLLNNGTHMIDFARMWFGEIDSIQRLGSARAFREGPIVDDDNPAFALNMQSGLVVTFQPLRFSQFRENGMIVWGERGRFDVMNEGLTLLRYPVSVNRAMSGQREIVCDSPVTISSTVGESLYRMYTNLAETLDARSCLWSPGSSALVTARIVDAVRAASASGERTETSAFC
jgi:predicted dehydrogenase